MNGPAIFFHSDAIEGDGKDLVGRRAAGQSFLQAFCTHVPGDAVSALVQTPSAAAALRKLLPDLGIAKSADVAVLRGQDDFTRFGSIFFPGPGFLGATWRRQRFGVLRCSLVGITHTVSTRKVIEGLHNLLAEPVAPWDAIICTSRAVQSVVQEQFDREAEYFRAHFGASRVPLPALPIIPLGIHADDFTQTDAARNAMRHRFDVPDDAIVVMTMGRLTSVEKANPAPLFIALEQVARRTGKAIHLWMVGWSRTKDEINLHQDGAKALAPSVTVKLIDGRKPDLRRHIWAGADIFTLPVDNIQETFGLAPVEAMAAGLPVVMPDWNGFRDTVRHGRTGYLIPTRMTAPGGLGGRKMAERFADGTDSYLRMLILTQQQTAIDIPAYVDALATLVDDPDKRRTMGRAGQRHVAENLDWSAVIPLYLDLADELAQMRAAAGAATAATAIPSPVEVDPFTLYAGYPSDRLSPDSVITLRTRLTAETLAALDAVNGRTLYKRRLLPDPDLLRVADTLGDMGATPLGALQDRLPMQPDTVEAVILFLLKFDLVTLDPAGSN